MLKLSIVLYGNYFITLFSPHLHLLSSKHTIYCSYSFLTVFPHQDIIFIRAGTFDYFVHYCTPSKWHIVGVESILVQ